MIFNNKKYRRNIAIITLIFYLVISGISAFHYHQTGICNEASFSKLEKVQIDLFNDDNFCKLYSFSSIQFTNLNSIVNLFSPESDILINIISDKNILSLYYYNNSKRGPPQLI